MSLLVTRISNLSIGIESGLYRLPDIPEIFSKISYPRYDIKNRGDDIYYEYRNKFTRLEFGFTQNEYLFNNDEMALSEDFNNKLISHLLACCNQIESIIEKENIPKPFEFITRIDRECLFNMKTKTGHEWSTFFMPIINCCFGSLTYEKIEDSGIITHYYFSTNIFFLPDKYKEKYYQIDRPKNN